MLSSFDYLALGYEGSFASVVKAGDLVEHYGTRQWARVLRVVPQRDRTVELEIEGICRHTWDDPSVRWWSSCRIGDWIPSYGPIYDGPARGTVR